MDNYAALLVLLLALGSTPAESAKTDKAQMTLCSYPQVDSWVAQTEDRPDLVLVTEKEQTTFHIVLLGRPASQVYDEVRFYIEGTSVGVILIKNGCTFGVGQLPLAFYLAAKEKYKGKVTLNEEAS